jgi:hypothetical protein
MGDYSWIKDVLPIAAQVAAGAKGEQEAGQYTDAQKKILSEIYAKLSDPANFPQLQAPQLGASQEGAVRTDPALRSAQMNALSKMKEIEDNGGLTLGDMAVQKKTTDMANRSASALHQKVLEGMARRGVGGSGAELAANLQGNQDAAERANEAGMQSQANAQKRYFDAIMGRSKMAGDLRGQDFDQASRSAHARDIRDTYNNTNQFDANKYNARMPVELAGLQMGSGNTLAGFQGAQAQNSRNFWGNMGTAAYEGLKNRGGSSSSSSDGGYSAPPMVNADNSVGGTGPGYGADGYPIESNPDEWEQGW